jgi:GAF domain-containing protein
MDKFRALLNDLGDALDNEAMTTEGAARLVSLHIQQRLNCSRVSLWSCEGVSGQRVMRRVAFHDPEVENASPDALVQLHEPDCGQYFADLQRNSILVCSNARGEKRLGRMDPLYLQPAGITAFVDAAIGVNGSLWGMLSCSQRGASRRFTAAEVGLVKRYADAVSIRRAQRRMRAAEGRDLLSSRF